MRNHNLNLSPALAGAIIAMIVAQTLPAAPAETPVAPTAAASPGAIPGAPAAQPQDLAEGYRLSPRAFRAAIEAVKPSLVTIESFGGMNPIRGGRQVGGVARPGEGPTTGLIVSPDGYIITSTYNFVRKPPIITVVFADHTERVAKQLGQDETRKLCLLKVDGVKDLPVPRFVAAKDLHIGQWALSVGVGYGSEDPAVSAGIVSATGRIFGKAVQTDANTSPANYGGPLLDVEGHVIGICVPLSPQGQGADAGVEWYDSGIGFAVPLFGSEEWLEQLKAGKTILPGKMGVQVAAVDPTGVKEGVAIQSIMDKSAAKAAGLQKGDVILAVNGDKVQDLMALRTIMGRYVAGDQVTLKIRRGSEELEVKATLDSGAEEIAPPAPIQITPPKPRDVPKTQPAPKAG
jgi:serine protease Do